MPSGYTAKDKKGLKAALDAGYIDAGTFGDVTPQKDYDFLNAPGGLRDWQQGVPGVGDEGSSTALAQAQAAPKRTLDESLAPTPKAPAPKFDSSAIDKLYKEGKLTAQQYASMGGVATADNAPVPKEQIQGAVVAKPEEQAADQQQPPEKEETTTIPSMGGGGGGGSAGGFLDTMDPQSREMQQAGEATQVAGQQAGAQAEAEGLQHVTNVQEQGQKLLAAHDELNRIEYDLQKGRFEQHVQDLQKHANEVASQKVDPDRWMKSKTTGERVLLAIGAALSGFQSGFKGGPNQVLQIMRDSINDDIEAQAKNIENSKEGLRTEQGLLADKWRLFQDGDKARAAARQEMMLDVAGQIDLEAKKWQSPAILARAQELKGALMRDFAKEGSQGVNFFKATGGGVGADQINKALMPVLEADRAAGIQITPQHIQQRRGEIAQTLLGNQASETPGMARPMKGDSKGPSQKTQDEIEAHKAAIQNIDALLKLREKHHGGTALSNDNDAADAYAARAQEQLVAALGRTNKGLLDRTSKLVPDHPLAMKFVGAFGLDPIGTRLRTARKQLQDELDRVSGANPNAGATTETRKPSPGFRPVQ